MNAVAMPKPDARPVLLLTRPEPGARRFAVQAMDMAKAHGLRVLIAPLMRIIPVAHDTARLAAARGVILTSEHAVPAAGPGRGRPALCVGARTARVAARAGWSVTAGPGDAAGLAPIVAAWPDREGWLHPHGRHLAADMGVAGIVVYDQCAAPPPPALLEALHAPAPVIWPLFSPRSATLAGDAAAHAAADGARAPLSLVAISPAAAAAWTGPDPQRLVIAGQPDAASMLATVELIARQETRARPAG